jgi:hypothetical protein
VNNIPAGRHIKQRVFCFRIIRAKNTGSFVGPLFSAQKSFHCNHHHPRTLTNPRTAEAQSRFGSPDFAKLMDYAVGPIGYRSVGPLDRLRLQTAQGGSALDPPCVSVVTT